MARKKAVFSLFLLTLLFFIAPLDSLAEDENSAANPTFQDFMAKREALQAEQVALGVQWQANRARMAQMENRYNFLQAEIESKQADLEKREGELAALQGAFDAARPALDARVAALNARKSALNDEVIGFNRACGRNFSEAEEAAYNACQARRSLLQSQENTLNREIRQHNAELGALTKPIEEAKKDYFALRDGLLTLANESQNLIRERTSLQQENSRLIDQGRWLSAEIEKTGPLAVNAMAGGDFLAALNAPRTKADYILEALEYGDGDWGSSIKFLADLTSARPEDRAALEAKSYLEGLAADLAGGGD